MRSKKVIVSLILVILVLFGYIVYKEFNSQQNSFRKLGAARVDSVIHFENKSPYLAFNYPSSLTKLEKNSDYILYVGDNNITLTVEIEKNPSKYNLDIQEIKDRSKDGDIGVSIKNVDQHTIYSYSQQSSGGDYSFSRISLIPLDSQVVKIAVSPKEESEFSFAEQVTDQIISSIKFTR